MGSAKETLGRMTGTESWQRAGAEQRARGQSEYEAARTQDLASQRAAATRAGVDVHEVQSPSSIKEPETPSPADMMRVDLESGKESPIGTVLR